jgi:hypothetical protein
LTLNYYLPVPPQPSIPSPPLASFYNPTWGRHGHKKLSQATL